MIQHTQQDEHTNFTDEVKIIDRKCFNKGTAIFDHVFKTREKNQFSTQDLGLFSNIFFIEIIYRWPDLSNLITRKSCLFELLDVDKEGLCRHQVNERDKMP